MRTLTVVLAITLFVGCADKPSDEQAIRKVLDDGTAALEKGANKGVKVPLPHSSIPCLLPPSERNLRRRTWCMVVNGIARGESGGADHAWC